VDHTKGDRGFNSCMRPMDGDCSRRGDQAWNEEPVQGEELAGMRKECNDPFAKGE
jgi:hypothetical protein